MDNLNQLSSGSRSGSFTVAGVASEPRGGDGGWGYPAGVSNVVVSGTGLSSGNADIYTDGAWARTNATLADGNNTYNATASDTYGRTASDSVTVNLPATPSFQYDGNGNLTNDGRRVLEYDFENQLTNVYVASGWRSEFRYDAFGRQRVRREYTWSSGAWLLTNEVRLVYDGMLVVQERDANNLAQVSYTRGNDLSGSLQGAGGIGGLLARTDMPSTINPQPSTSPHAYYHCDGNGNVTALVSTNGIMLARYSYDPYGNLLGLSGPLAEANRYRFSSKEWNGNAGVYYYGYRFYDGGLQRWVNRDRINERGGINLYGFLFNNPINWLDPYGLAIVFVPPDWQGPPAPGDTLVPCPEAPGDVSLHHNMGEAEELGEPWRRPNSSPIAGLKAAVGFRDRVKSGGPWDFKTRDPKYENFGNFHYGAAGSAFGFDSLTLQNEAGIAQQNDPRTKSAGRGLPGPHLWPEKGIPPYGDEPKDNDWIKKGIEYNNQYPFRKGPGPCG